LVSHASATCSSTQQREKFFFLLFSGFLLRWRRVFLAVKSQQDSYRVSLCAKKENQDRS
jgi:hypothetical protein